MGFHMRGICSMAEISACLTLSFACPIALAEQPFPRSVLVLDQSEPGMTRPGYSEIFENLRSTLGAEPTSRIALYRENLDLDHFNDPRHETNLRNYLKEKYLETPIGV